MFSRICTPFTGAFLSFTHPLTYSTMSPRDSLVHVTVKDRIATVTIDNPRSLNAIGVSTLHSLKKVFTDLAVERWCDKNHDVRKGTIGVMILTGGGDKAFSTGANILDFKDADERTVTKNLQLAREVSKRIDQLPFPTIAEFNGYTFGLGLELGLACDLRYASDNSLFAFREIILGLIPGCRGTQLLPRLVGESRAKEMMFTGKPTDALRALHDGLINGVYPQENLKAEVLTIAQEIAKNSPKALEAIKVATRKGRDSLELGLMWEEESFVDCHQSWWSQKAVSEFLKKNEPK